METQVNPCNLTIALIIYFSHKVTLDTDSLLELYSHTFSVRLWNSPDKVSARARYDRPKAFRLPLSKRDPKDNKLHFPGVYHDLSTTSVKIARHRSRRLSEQIDLEGMDDSMEYLASQKSQTMPSIIEEIHFEEKNDPISNTQFSQTQINGPSQSTMTSASLTPGLRGKHTVYFMHRHVFCRSFKATD